MDGVDEGFAAAGRARQARRAARRTVASHARDGAELAVFLGMLDLRPEIDHLPRGVDEDLSSFNDT
ncbi:hypothetical protein AMK16_20710 [Streptomyces sp. CB00455]|uniref:hypothetical protein n=1 Tax=Streptomyces sp. CB00455 TaxID=1703927 RepID=UPI00093B5AAA|nr:hypothetical protein [Streptomyces sp. CB00455]OKK17292.1 hypothetical protein AMK16_20710 [Streptomyces sp. CB00455]